MFLSFVYIVIMNKSDHY